ncbi:hypothetical protein DFH07DRAFT_898856 [Mycena maculata]|uniref:Uncharacterized protein n=1 Tax=Mycena maculata TaxID=230809 RepID=A0AAD7HFL7_9AGAR|nr:hypothetical protein DFH07DRAFT_898856 [Mycena maculata]
MSGKPLFERQICSLDTHLSLMVSVMVSIYLSLSFIPPSLRLIAPLWSPILTHSGTSSVQNLMPSATSVLSPQNNSRTSSVLSNPRLSPWFRSRMSSKKCDSSKTTPSLGLLAKIIRLSIITSILTTSRVPGARSMPCASRSRCFHQTRRWASETSLRHTGIYPLTHRSGQVQFSACLLIYLTSPSALNSIHHPWTFSLRTQVSALENPPEQAHMGLWQMPLPTFCVLPGSGRPGSGLMIRYSSASLSSTPNIPIISMTLTGSRSRWEFRGNSPRTSNFPMLLRSRASSGTWICGASRLLRRKRQSIWHPSRRGNLVAPTSCQTSRNSMGNSSIHALLLPRDVHTSPAWRPCWASTVIVRSCRKQLLIPLPPTSIGGENVYRGPICPDLFQVPARSLISLHSPTPAPGSELPSLSVLIGGHGASCVDGNRSTDISVGPKPWASNSWFAQSSPRPAPTHLISSSTETTLASLRVGGTDVAQTGRSTEFFVTSIPCLPSPASHSTPLRPLPR